MRSSASALAAAVTLALAGAGCSSEPATEETEEGALSLPAELQGDRFQFRVNSPEEQQGVDARNAYGAAVLAKAVYLEKSPAEMAAVLKQLGVGDVREKDVLIFEAKKSGLDPRTHPIINGTNGMYVKTASAGFLVFRGSEDGVLQDALTNAQVNGVNPGGVVSNNRAGLGKAHSGYFLGVKSVWSQIRDRLAKEHGDAGRSKLPLYVIGHSLGGAVGQIAMHHLLFDSCIGGVFNQLDLAGTCEEKYIPVTALYAFGSPRIGDEEFATTLASRAKQTGTRVFRFVNEKDQVSMLPRHVPIPQIVLPPYRHIGVGGDERAFAIYLGKDGELVAPVDAPSSCSGSDVAIEGKNLKDIVQCDLTMSEFLSGIAAGKPPWRTEHSMALYKEKLKITAQIALLGLSPKDPKTEDLRKELKASLERLRAQLASMHHTDSR
ncbi:MAG: lipase family protein [Myxococcales bacterium]|nr:lipase family protein [Myxococcales bacterium]